MNHKPWPLALELTEMALRALQPTTVELARRRKHSKQASFSRKNPRSRGPKWAFEPHHCRKVLYDVIRIAHIISTLHAVL